MSVPALREAGSLASRAPTSRGRPPSRKLEKLGGALVVISSAVLLIGIIHLEPWILSAAGALGGLGFISIDTGQVRRGGITPATLYAAGFALTSFANMVAFLSADSPTRSGYFLYAVEEHFVLATVLSLAGGFLPILGFYAVSRNAVLRFLVGTLPKISNRVSDNGLVPAAAALSLLAMAVRFAVPLGAFGTLSFIVDQLPHMATFTLARAGWGRRVPYAIPVALGIALLEAIRALLFSYLRMEMVSPLFAFVVGALLGARSFGPLRSKLFIPVYVAMALFVISFATLGEVRVTTGGTERVGKVVESELRRSAEEDPVVRQSLLGRLTNFNQLSQVGRIVREDGFLDGETLEYLGYALIPRFLWPGKPAIAKGAWFALRIGQARVLDGRITNSVNMTIPGELYLNFGPLGVILGCLLFGAIMGAFWLRTDFWSNPRNVLGGAFAYYLLASAFSLGADLQVLVSSLAIYMIFVALSVVVGGSRSVHRLTARPRIAATPVRLP